MSFLSDFKQPPAHCRPHPFWFWNGDMRDEEIEQQIEEMAQKGLGGFFLCARQGLKIPYLSQEWFRKVGVACRAAERNQIACWLYDEYPYPSGMAGGEVLVRHPEAAHRTLAFRSFFHIGGPLQQDLGQGNVLCVKAVPLAPDNSLVWENALDLSACVGVLQTQEICQPQQGAYLHFRYFTYGVCHVLHTEILAGRWKIIAITEEPLTDFKYYGNFFDPCCPEAVRTFIELTHEAYRKQLGEDFRLVHGIFSDETGLLGDYPWSHQMLKEFPRRKGYSLQENLMALAEQSYPNAAAIRRDYIEALNEVFVDSYHRQIADWCRKNEILYATEVPSLRMSTQRYSTVVGGDAGHEKAGKPLEQIYDAYLCGYRYNPKHVGSLASQLNKRYAMIESFHSVGWTMTLQDAKWMLDRIGSDGINLFNFHAFCYTIDTLAKFDAPPSQFLQNPYWEHYHLLTDYAGRLSALNTWSVAAEELAVLDPAASLWEKMANPLHAFAYGGTDAAEKAKLAQQIADWKWVEKTLLTHQLNYQTLDAQILCDARVCGGTLHLGRATYRAVVLPPLDYLEENALTVLREFARQGGCVIAVDAPDAIKASLQCHSICVGDVNGLLETVQAALCLPVYVRVARGKGSGVMVSHRLEKSGKRFVFVANQNATPTQVTLALTDSAFASFVGWSLETGETYHVPQKGGCTRLAMAPFESCLLELSPRATRSCAVQAEQTRLLQTNTPMELVAQAPNLYRLDGFDLSLDGKQWRNIKTPTIIEQLAETGLMSARQLCWHGQFGTPKRLTVRYPLSLRYRKHFFIHTLPAAADLMLDAGCISGTYRLWINGSEVLPSAFSPAWHYDHANRAQPVGKLLVQGENCLEIEVCAQKDDDGLRGTLYLCGDFGVYFPKELGLDIALLAMHSQCKPHQDGMISSAPHTGVYGNLYVQGYPYYSGTLCFYYCEIFESKPKGNQIFALAHNRSNDCVELFVNGQSIGVRAFAPYRWQVSDQALTAGENEFMLRVQNTLANALEGEVFDSVRHAPIPVWRAARQKTKDGQ